MTLTLEQLNKIIKYSTQRMYYGDWNADQLEIVYTNASCYHAPLKLKIGELTEDFICDVLWYEMSYNPVRFGNISPFKKPDGKNSILYFLATYRKIGPKDKNGLLPKNLMNLVWRIGDFIDNLKKAHLYDNFKETGKLPAVIETIGKDAEYRTITALRKAIHSIASQNLQDLERSKYKESMLKIIQQRHPTGKRCETSYMAVKLEYAVQQQAAESQETKTAEEVKKVAQKTISKPKVVQTCLPFEHIPDPLVIIRDKIIEKRNEIDLLEQQINDLKEIGYVDLREFRKKLKRTKLQFAALCSQEAQILKKIQKQNSNENSGH